MSYMYLICSPQVCQSICCNLLEKRASIARALADHAAGVVTANLAAGMTAQQACEAAVAAQRAFVAVATQDKESAWTSFGARKDTASKNTAKASSGPDVHLQASADLRKLQFKIADTLYSITDWVNAPAGARRMQLARGIVGSVRQLCSTLGDGALFSRMLEEDTAADLEAAAKRHPELREVLLDGVLLDGESLAGVQNEAVKKLEETATAAIKAVTDAFQELGCLSGRSAPARLPPALPALSPPQPALPAAPASTARAGSERGAVQGGRSAGETRGRLMPFRIEGCMLCSACFHALLASGPLGSMPLCLWPHTRYTRYAGAQANEKEKEEKEKEKKERMKRILSLHDTKVCAMYSQYRAACRQVLTSVTEPLVPLVPDAGCG
jgi:hypothetical protein